MQNTLDQINHAAAETAPECGIQKEIAGVAAEIAATITEIAETINRVDYVAEAVADLLDLSADAEITAKEAEAIGEAESSAAAAERASETRIAANAAAEAAAEAATNLISKIDILLGKIKYLYSEASTLFIISKNEELRSITAERGAKEAVGNAVKTGLAGEKFLQLAAVASKAIQIERYSILSKAVEAIPASMPAAKTLRDALSQCDDIGERLEALAQPARFARDDAISQHHMLFRASTESSVTHNAKRQKNN